MRMIWDIDGRVSINVEKIDYVTIICLEDNSWIVRVHVAGKAFAVCKADSKNGAVEFVDATF